MGLCNSRQESRQQRDNRIRDEGRAEGRAELGQRTTGKYWHCIKDVWRFERASYDGCFEKGLKHRRDNPVQLYQEVHDILMRGEGIEAYLDGENPKSVFSVDGEETVITTDTNGHAPKGKTNRKESQKHEREHRKNILGESIVGNEKSRAHAFPNDKDCNIWWWPMFGLVTGYDGSGDWGPLDDKSKEALNMLTTMRTNKIVFPGPHNHIFDDLTDGIVCTIPIYDSMEAMANWQYKDGYKMLIVCDSAATYKKLRMFYESSYAHIEIASESDVKMATLSVGEMMKILADSLVTNWDNHYEYFEGGSRKEMLSRMRDMLMDKSGKVEIPQYNLPEDEDPKMFVIDYAVLYQKDKEEGAKYIHDPIPALIKAAINVSAFVNKNKSDEKMKDCKLLPVCPCLEDEKSEYSFDFLDVVLHDRLDTSVPEKTATESCTLELIGREVDVHVGSDDDEDEEPAEQSEDTDGSTSVGSDLTD